MTIFARPQFTALHPALILLALIILGSTTAHAQSEPPNPYEDMRGYLEYSEGFSSSVDPVRSNPASNGVIRNAIQLGEKYWYRRAWMSYWQGRMSGLYTHEEFREYERKYAEEKSWADYYERQLVEAEKQVEALGKTYFSDYNFQVRTWLGNAGYLDASFGVYYRDRLMPSLTHNSPTTSNRLNAARMQSGFQCMKLFEN
jgi:hypothetical protein